MRILLTGAGGQLGQALQRGFSRHEIVALGHRELDIGDLAAVRSAVDQVRPELVFNAAASTDVDGAEADPDTAFVGNALGPRNLALATAERSLELVHVSSDYVFDGTFERPYHEFDATGPLSVYGHSKLAGEEAVRSLNRRHYIVRSAWLYSTVGHNFALTMRSLAERPEVGVVSDQYGSPTYVPHLVEALETLIDTGAHGTYHLAGSGGTSWFEFAQAIFAELGAPTSVVPIATADMPRDARRPRYSVLTTLQQPHIELPPWREGVRAFAKRLGASAS